MTGKAPRRILTLLVAWTLWTLLLTLAAHAAESFDFVYLGRDGDVAYQPTKAYTGLVLCSCISTLYCVGLLRTPP